MKVELNLANYATKADLKEITDIRTSNLAVKSDLPSLKVEVDETDTAKIITVSTDVSRLSKKWCCL